MEIIGGGNHTAQAELLLDLMGENSLDQCVKVPTRIINVLDLFMTNIPDMVNHVAVEDTSQSFHRISVIDTNLFTSVEKCRHLTENEGLVSVNFLHSKVNWE